MSIRHITIITFAWPPRNSIGAHRPYSWAKYWSKAGIKVRVITAKKYEYDEPLDLDLPLLKGVELIEVDYSSRNKIYRILLKGVVGKFLRRIYRKRKIKLLPNPRELWVPKTLKSVRQWSSDTDVVISTYDPKGVHLIASAFKDSNPNLLWIADYRDLWSLNHVQSINNIHAERKLEIDSVGRNADAVTSVSEALTRQQGMWLDKPFFTVYNGFDLNIDELKMNLATRNKKPTRRLNIIYTGKVYPKLRDPTPLLAGIEKIDEEGLLTDYEIILHFYGSQIDGLEAIFSNERYKRKCVFHGHVTREEALEAQRNADLLLLLESPKPEASGVLTGKLFEYISSGVPILSVGSSHDSAIASVLHETGCGVVLEEDKDKISSVLKERVQLGASSWFNPNINAIMKYSRENQARELLNQANRLFKSADNNQCQIQK